MKTKNDLLRFLEKKGFKSVTGRTPTKEEQAHMDRVCQEFKDFLLRIDDFEEKSRKANFCVGRRSCLSAQTESWLRHFEAVQIRTGQSKLVLP